MNLLNPARCQFTFQDGFLPVKILAGERIFELLASHRTSIIFGITDGPWAAAAFRINELIIQLEPNLNEWDAIAIAASENARLVRHNTLIYELHCTISPEVTGLHSNFFYRCPQCNGHIYECTHLLMRDQPPNQSPQASTELAPAVCPNCGGKVQCLAPGVSFCLDCDWEHGLEPID